MASPRSSIFDGVDPQLLELVKYLQQSHKPYGVSITSGLRQPSGGNRSFHHPDESGRGRAIDFQLYDRKSGQRLANYKDPTHAKAYQTAANEVYQQALRTNPELAKRLRWGGYFGLGGQHSLDLMHLDLGGDKVGMQGGSWQSGWTPEMMKHWGLDQSGGAGGATAGTSMQGPPGPDAVRRAFLASIARGEAPDYNVLYGGGKFSDYSKHPGQTISGPDPFDPKRQLASTAAGKYQFLKSTWDEQAAKYGYKDFSPETQDTAAWNYANDTYKAKTGRDLATDLSSRDPALINQAGTALKEVWPSLPGGSQTGKAWEGKQFSDVYSENLGMGDDGQPAQGSNPLQLTVKAQPEKPAASPYAKAGGFLADALSGMGKSLGAGATPAVANPYATKEATTVPMAMSTPSAPTPIVDPKQQELQRQQLALAMQRLNTGRLW